MKKKSWISNIEPQKFNFKPRYYDEEKEELQRRLDKAEKKHGEDIEAVKLRITDGIHRTSNQNREWKSQLTRQSNRRVFLIIMVLMVLTFILILIYYPYLAQL